MRQKVIRYSKEKTSEVTLAARKIIFMRDGSMNLATSHSNTWGFMRTMDVSHA
jgi:hypothetical protein